MISRYLFTLFPLLLLGSTLHMKASGVFDRVDVGIYLTLINLEDQFDTTVVLMLGGEAGLNIPLYRPADNMAFGLNPQIGLSTDLSASLGASYSSILNISFPLYATFKLNTDASKRGTKASFGFTVGAGVHYTGSYYINSDVTIGYLAPAALAEINFGSRRGKSGLFKIRYTAQLTSTEVEIPEFNQSTFFREQGVHLVWTPGY